MSDSRKYRYIREDLQNKHASYVKAGSGTKLCIDDKVMNQGEEWYNLGHSLEQADPSLQSDVSFVRGYERAARIAKINEDLYQLGMEYFEKGIPLTEIPANYINKDAFISGYSAALGARLKKGAPRR